MIYMHSSHTLKFVSYSISWNLELHNNFMIPKGHDNATFKVYYVGVKSNIYLSTYCINKLTSSFYLFQHFKVIASEDLVIVVSCANDAFSSLQWCVQNDFFGLSLKILDRCHLKYTKFVSFYLCKQN